MILLAAVVLFASMIGEAVLAARNDSALRAQGAVEPSGDVYAIMQIAYPASFLVMLIEGAIRSAGPYSTFWIGAAIFAAGKALKYWAIATLGPRWTFRVLVPTGGGRIRRGPYRWLAHPNYVGVAGELLGAAIAMRAIVSGPLAVAGFTYLMLRRVAVEDTALRVAEQNDESNEGERAQRASMESEGRSPSDTR
jgi:methyltransferase